LDATDRKQTLLATDYLDSEGSAVNSAIALANAVVDALNTDVDVVEVSLVGLKGAASSYFNVFLRRVDEACGLDGALEHVRMRFGSRVQEMMYRASMDALKRGIRQRDDGPTPEPAEAVPPKRSWLVRLFRRNRA